MEQEPEQALPVGPAWAPCASQQLAEELAYGPVTAQVLGQAQQLGTWRAAAQLAPALVPEAAMQPLLELAAGQARAVVGPQAAGPPKRAPALGRWRALGPGPGWGGAKGLLRGMRP